LARAPGAAIAVARSGESFGSASALQGDTGARAPAIAKHAAAPAGLLILQDVTEVRRRDRALMTKDATIREIHHRVKNNLQTVASLLRLQARAADLDPRKALEDSVNRILAIAAVHEVLCGDVGAGAERGLQQPHANRYV
jgi:hypothetical protein